MGKKAFYIYNLIIFLLLLSLNLLALFGAGMSQDGIYPYMWFGTGFSFVAWLIFYLIQFARANKSWRISWFLIMLVFLIFWETGFGYRVGLMIFD